MLSNIVLIVLGITAVVYLLKNSNWQISTHSLVISIFLLQIITSLIPPDYLLLSSSGIINATSWIKYFGKIQVILVFIFCVLAAIIYYKTKKADQIQFAT